jgi:hypothetical protein
MSDKRYCYCCRTYHPAEQVILFETKAGKRWRCLRSIDAAQSPRELRDATGRRQSAENRELANQKARNSLALRHSRLAFA